jgi:hypothetical protein
MCTIAGFKHTTSGKNHLLSSPPPSATYTNSRDFRIYIQHAYTSKRRAKLRSRSHIDPNSAQIIDAT